MFQMSVLSRFSSSLMSLICDLLESSVNIQQQLIQNKGFLVISYLLEKVSSARLFFFLLHKNSRNEGKRVCCSAVVLLFAQAFCEAQRIGFQQEVKMCKALSYMHALQHSGICMEKRFLDKGSEGKGTDHGFSIRVDIGCSSRLRCGLSSSTLSMTRSPPLPPSTKFFRL